MKKIVNKIAKVLQVILLAPVKLPNKALNVVKYIALGLGIVESVLEKDTDRPANEKTAASADLLDGSRQDDDLDKDKKAVKRIRRKGGADALE
ncbi:MULTISPECIES: hypothetical protein [unclassified Sphingobacterium]|uniref:hypothetical protein n=1 Tax=unclassified Sphingobacterium TaxID=2609468 RepID=UPI0025CF417A|nr:MULTISPECIES: hypothetical protein [unclassified Sphingobacterium]